MEIRSVKHKALRSYLETGRPVGIDARVASRLKNMVAFLVAANAPEELQIPPNFGFHWLTGSRSGTAAMTIAKNWRLTFKLTADLAVVDLNLEDYH